MTAWAYDSRVAKAYVRGLLNACKVISAKDAAERAGLHLVQRGSRAWANCFLHKDNHPSMLFNENGTFKCFSCGKTGDAVRLYELLYNQKPLDAAKQLMADFGLAEEMPGKLHPIPAKKVVTEKELQKAVADIVWSRINQILDIKYNAYARMKEIESDMTEPTDADFDKLEAEIAKCSAASVLIETIETLTFQQQADWIERGAKFDAI